MSTTMQNHYEINVSLNGKHLFATDPRSARDKQKAELLFTVLRAKFPENDGYTISVTRWEGIGTRQDWQ
jgi:hypothetical protein